MTHDTEILLNKIKSHAEALDTLQISRDDHALLGEQTALLNALFTDITLAHLQADTQTHESLNWLALALTAQKQCTQAIKAKAACNYMDTLSTLNANMPHFPIYYEQDPETGLTSEAARFEPAPAPAENDERKEGI